MRILYHVTYPPMCCRFRAIDDTEADPLRLSGCFVCRMPARGDHVLYLDQTMLTHAHKGHTPMLDDVDVIAQALFDHTYVPIHPRCALQWMSRMPHGSHAWCTRYLKPKIHAYCVPNVRALRKLLQQTRRSFDEWAYRHISVFAEETMLPLARTLSMLPSRLPPYPTALRIAYSIRMVAAWMGSDQPIPEGIEQLQGQWSLTDLKYLSVFHHIPLPSPTVRTIAAGLHRMAFPDVRLFTANGISATFVP